LSGGELPLAAFVLAVGFVSSLFAGIVGVGAVLLIAPLLYFGTPLLGVAMDFKQISNLTTFAVLVAALRSILIYRGFGLVRPAVIRPLVLPSLVGAAGGVVIASQVTAHVIQLVFAASSIVGALIALLPYQRALDNADRELHVNPPAYAVAAGGVGLVGGLAGAGGGFLMLPLLLSIFHLPTRLALAAAAVSGTIIAITAFAGRIALIHLDWLLVLAIGIGAYAGADIGTRFQQQVPTLVIRRAIAVVVGLSALRMLVRFS
jgi:uncharacterized membrane protein YfcA